VDRLKAQTTENELLRKELRNVRAKLEQEQSSRSAYAAEYFGQYFLRANQLTLFIGWFGLGDGC
jgi:hypothetical protein